MIGIALKLVQKRPFLYKTSYINANYTGGIVTRPLALFRPAKPLTEKIQHEKQREGFRERHFWGSNLQNKSSHLVLANDQDGQTSCADEQQRYRFVSPMDARDYRNIDNQTYSG